jgi:hypothetical protein
MEEAVCKLAADSGTFHRAVGTRQAEGYTLLHLAFEHGSLRLGCDADTDEITVSAGPPTEPEGDLAEIDDDPALASLRGKVIELAWTMRNHRGYADAFQIRCLDLTTREESCCQFEAAAAAFTIARIV